eukprot:jgi/Undpi1/6794/HiC_scaffold_21.g09270.m1
MLTFMLPWTQVQPRERRVLFSERALIPSYRVVGQWTNCLSFDLPSLDLTGYESGCTSGYNPSAFVTVEWYESFDPFDEDNYTAAVALYLGDETEPEFTLIPYSRLIESSDGSSSLESHYMVTTVTFGKTTRYPLSGDSTTSYPILTIATSDYVDYSRSDYSSDTDDGHNDSYAQADDSYARGYLHLTLTQGTYSVTDIRDIDPDIGNLLGNIGGFWELVLVAWGVCFIATRVDIPTHRGRNFTKVIRKAKNIAGKRKRRRSSTGTEASDAEEYVNGPAEWSAEEKACQDVSRGDDIIVVPPADSDPTRPTDALTFSLSSTGVVATETNAALGDGDRDTLYDGNLVNRYSR